MTDLIGCQGKDREAKYGVQIVLWGPATFEQGRRLKAVDDVSKDDLEHVEDQKGKADPLNDIEDPSTASKNTPTL